MSRAARPYRVQPGNVHRMQPPDANAVRRHWRDLAAAAIAMAGSASASDGREAVEPLEFRHALTRAPGFPAKTGDAGAAAVARSFREISAAFLGAGTEARRALLAAPMAALARAVDALLDEEIAPQVAHWRRMAGETEGDWN